MSQIRQGDVCLEPVKSLPDNMKPIERDGGRIVLAYGEATGHAHAIASLEADFYETVEGERYLDVRSDVALNHEEHSTATVKKGKYKVIQQREYSPEEIRNVRD